MKTLKSLVVIICLNLPIIAIADPAVVITPSLCGMYDGNGNFVLVNNIRIVSTQSENNNLILKCKGEVAPPSSGKAAHFNGFSCGAWDQFGIPHLTQDTHEIVSVDGQATLVCNFKDL